MPGDLKKGRRGRKNSALPKMFRRGSKGLFYFRRRVSGKDKWISLGSTDEDVAKQELLKIIDSHTSIAAISRLESSAQKLAEVFVEGVTGRKSKTVPLLEAYGKWVSVTPDYNDIGEDSRKFYGSFFRRFREWAESRGLDSCGQITSEIAKSYAKGIWDSGISGKTYNEHLRLLSRVFDSIDAVTPLPDRDPFAKRHIKRRGKLEMASISHEALEPKQMKNVLREAAANGHDWRDLFMIGAHTGMRLKDAALLEWKSVGKSFIDIKPYKTLRSGNEARIPISPRLSKIFAARLSNAGKGRYVIPSIAEHYLKNPDYVVKKAKDIFNTVLGEEATRSSSSERHRVLSASIYSFHSFRTTFMSLLAQQDVSARDAMRIMGWESPAMIEVYERELERAKGDADTRALKLIGSINELKISTPKITEPSKPFRPTGNQLKNLVEKYSNVTIGKIFGVSSVAVKKWLDKYGISHAGRIQSNITDDKALAKIRDGLKGQPA